MAHGDTTKIWLLIAVIAQRPIFNHASLLRKSGRSSWLRRDLLGRVDLRSPRISDLETKFTIEFGSEKTASETRPGDLSETSALGDTGTYLGWQNVNSLVGE